MSSEFVKKIEENFYNNETKSCSINDWRNVFSKATSSQLFLFFFRKCSEKFLACQDEMCCYIVHGLVKSQLSVTYKAKILRMVLIRGVDTNQLDGTGKTVLDYLIDDNDDECTEVLLEHGQNLQVSDKCLTRAFQLRNQQQKLFKLLFAYAIKHNIAPHLTGVSDGDTFLHEMVLQEKEKISFKEWLGYFLSFSAVNINAVDHNNCTPFDLMLLNYEKERCKCFIKLVIKYKFPSTSDDILKLPQFLLNQKSASDHLNEVFQHSLEETEHLTLQSDEVITDDQFATNNDEGVFSHKYLKLKQCIPCSSTKKLQHIPDKLSLNVSSHPTKLPNHEEVDLLFEIETSCLSGQEKTNSSQKCKGKKSQKSLLETAEVKTYLSTKETLAFCSSMTEKNSKLMHFCTQVPSTSNDSGYKVQEKHLKGLHLCTQKSNDSGYEEEKITRDTISYSKVAQQLSTVAYNTKSLRVNDLSKYRKIGQGAYGAVYYAICNGQPCVAKAIHPYIEKSSTQLLKKEINILSSLNHPNIVQYLGVHNHGNTQLLVMEKMWLSLSNWLKINLLPSFNSKIYILTDVANGLKYLHSLSIIHRDLTANNVLLSTNLQAKICDFGMADKIGENMIQLPGNPSHMPPEACIPNPQYTEKLDIFSFGCVMIHTITQEFPIVDTVVCSKVKEIDKRSKYLEAINGSPDVLSVILECLQDDPSCRPTASQLHCSIKACVKFKSLSLFHCSDGLSKHTMVGQGAYSIKCCALSNGQPCLHKIIHPFIPKNNRKDFLKEINILWSVNVVQYLNVHYHIITPLLLEKLWLNLSDWLGINPLPSLHKKLHILTDVANGLKYLHSQKLIYYDLTANNVLLSTNLQAKICDFGMAHKIGENMIQLPGDSSHIPSETCIPNPQYTEKLYIFSFGCVIIHTITQEFPIVDTVVCPKFKEIDKHSKYLEEMKDLLSISEYLQDNLSCRPTLYCPFKISKLFSSLFHCSDGLSVSQGSYSTRCCTLNNDQLCLGKTTCSYDIADTKILKEIRNVKSFNITPSIQMKARLTNGLGNLCIKNFNLAADNTLLSVKQVANICTNTVLGDPTLIHLVDHLNFNFATEELPTTSMLFYRKHKTDTLFKDLKPCLQDETINRLSVAHHSHLEPKSSFVLVSNDPSCCIVHGLVKSQLSVTAKAKILKMKRVLEASQVDYLIEDNDYKYNKILLKLQDLKISDKFFSKAFQLHNQQQNFWKLLFAYAVKCNRAQHLTDGDTFLQLQEKEQVSFKEWLRYFSLIPEVSINVVNKSGYTAFNLLFLDCDGKQRCEYATKFLFKCKFPNITICDCLELPTFPLYQETTREMSKTKKVFSKFIKIKVLDGTKGNEFNGSYCKCSGITCFLSSKMSFIAKKFSPSNEIKLPNVETDHHDLLFESKSASLIPLEESQTKPSQKSITIKFYKIKKHLSTKAYHKLMLRKSVNSENRLGGTYKTTLQLTQQELSTALSTNDNDLLYQKCELTNLEHTTRLDTLSFGCIMLHIITHELLVEEINMQSNYLEEIKGLPDVLSICLLQDDPTCKPTATQLHRLIKACAKVSLSNPPTLLLENLQMLANELEYLRIENLTADGILLSVKRQAKICDFEMAHKIGENMIQLPGNPSHMPLEACIPNQYTEKLYIFSFGCVMVHTITQEFPIVDTVVCSTVKEIDKHSKYLEAIIDLLSISECLQDNHPSCGPTLYCPFKVCVKIKPFSSLSKRTNVGQEPYNTKCCALSNDQLCIGKTTCSYDIADTKILKKIHSVKSFNCTPMIQHLGGNNAVTKNLWVSLSMGLKCNPPTLLLDKVQMMPELANGLNYLCTENIFHYDLNANTIVLSVKQVANTCNFNRIFGTNTVSGDPTLIHLKSCPVYTEEHLVDYLNFNFVTEEIPAASMLCSREHEIDTLLKNLKPCLQDKIVHCSHIKPSFVLESNNPSIQPCLCPGFYCYGSPDDFLLSIQFINLWASIYHIKFVHKKMINYYNSLHKSACIPKTEISSFITFVINICIDICKQRLLRRESSESPVITLTNKSLLHQGKLIYLDLLKAFHENIHKRVKIILTESFCAQINSKHITKSQASDCLPVFSFNVDVTVNKDFENAATSTIIQNNTNQAGDCIGAAIGFVTKQHKLVSTLGNSNICVTGEAADNIHHLDFNEFASMLQDVMCIFKYIIDYELSHGLHRKVMSLQLADLTTLVSKTIKGSSNNDMPSHEAKSNNIQLQYMYLNLPNLVFHNKEFHSPVPNALRSYKTSLQYVKFHCNRSTDTHLLEEEKCSVS